MKKALFMYLALLSAETLQAESKAVNSRMSAAGEYRLQEDVYVVSEVPGRLSPKIGGMQEFQQLIDEAAAHAAQRLSFNAYADIETAYWARGAIVDKNPYSAQFADLTVDLNPLGRIGGYVWSVSSLAKSGQSATRRNAYNELDYAVYYGYGIEFVEEWALETTVAKKWVTLPGYRPHANSISEWNISQSMKNPYVTPYYLLRRAYHGQKWCYWDVGLTRSWKFLDAFTFTATVFGELGDSRHFAAQYGANPHGDGRYSDGLMALNLMLRLDYAVTENIGLFAFVHQFDVVCDDARDALDRDTSPQSRKDMTIFGVGMALNF